MTLRSKELALGPVAVGAPVTASADIVNKGKLDAAFRVAACPGLLCTPVQGIVHAGDSASLAVTLTAAAEGSFTSAVQIERRSGGAPLKLPVTADAMLPRVSASVPAFEFGRVFQGSVRKMPFTLTNETPVAAKLACDLRSHPSFRLLVAKEDWTPAEYPQCPLINDVDGIAGALSARRQSRYAISCPTTD